MARYSTGQTLAALLSWVPDLLVPLLVVSILGREANAYFYVAFLIAAAFGNVADAVSALAR